MRHRWCKRNFCVYCGMVRRNKFLTPTAKYPTAYYQRMGVVVFVHAPECDGVWPEEWLPAMRSAFRIDPPPVQLTLVNSAYRG